jgi:alanine dehydrogenase
VLFLSADDVWSLLDRDLLVDRLAAAMVELSAGRASMPARIAAEVAEQGAFLAAMPAYLHSSGALTAKIVSVFPRNVEAPTHQALVCCFAAGTGEPLAVMDGASLTAARTAAGSALATRLLARRDHRVVAIVGSGVQAREHGMALSRLPGVEILRMAGRDRAKVAAVVDDLRAACLAGVEAAPSIESAVRLASVVCACTHSPTPVVRRAWLRPGAHVNSVGYNTAGAGEVDAETVRDARVFVESRASALAEPPAGAVELRGLVGAAGEVVEIGEVVAGTAPGRTDDDQVTLYKSVGVAVQDAAAAALVLEAAVRAGAGVNVDL